jgi:hypothetical protein
MRTRPTALLIAAAAALLAAAPAAGFVVVSGMAPLRLGRLTARAEPSARRGAMVCSMRSEPPVLGRRELLAAVAAAAVLPALPRPAAAGAPGAGELVLVIGATSTAGQDLCRDLLGNGF